MIRAVVKHSYLRGPKAKAKAKAHINYIQYRRGDDRDREPRSFFDDRRDEVLGRELKDRLDAQEQRGALMHKLILSPGVQGADLQQYTREMMEKIGREKGIDLEWYAVQHHNTAHPHVHVVVMGADRDGRQVRFDRDDHRKLRDFGGRYLEREHTYERYLDRELERLIGDRSYKPRDQRELERQLRQLEYGDDREKKRRGEDAERDRREWELLDRELHKAFNRNRGLEKPMTFRQYQTEAAGRLLDFHERYQTEQARERWQEVAETNPKLAREAERELAWLDALETESRMDRSGERELHGLLGSFERLERKHREPGEPNLQESREDRDQGDRSLADWLYRNQREDPSRFFERDRQARDQQQYREDRERDREERDKGYDLGR